MDQKPERMPIQFDQIPHELISFNNWILWKWEKRNGKWTKPPYQINGHLAKSNNPKTWSRFDEVYAAYKNGKFDGIGFMLGDDFSGIDWDNCRVPETGEIKPNILRRIKLINSYTEVSPSGTGCKTLLVGKLPAGGHHSYDIGVFNHTRYFAITGAVLPVVSNKIESRQAQLEALIREFWPNDFKLLKPQDNKPAGYDSIIEKALMSRDSRFSQLWAGDISGYDSHSEADLALCTRLAFWTGKDSQQIDALFRESGLMRDKWNRQDYRERTITNAINVTTEIFKTRGASYYNKPPKDSHAPGDNFKSIEPVDIFGDTILTGKPQWPDDACPKVIDEFARDAAERIGVDIEMVAMPSIICAAIAIPDNFKIQPKLYDTSWTEAPRLWGAVIAKPGQKKTPALRAATKPIKEIQFRYRDEYQEEWAIYESNLKLYESKSKKEKAKEDKPKAPIMRRIWTDELTVESLRETLNENMLGVGIVKDELSAWITSFDAYKNSQKGSSDRPHFCELYQGGAKVFDRVSNRNQFVKNWGASILGGIQPGPVQRLMGNITDDGLIARFIFCHAGRSDQDIDRAPHICCETYNQTIKRLPELKPRFNNDREIFTFDETGIEYRKQIGNTCRMIQMLPGTGDALSAHLNKWEAIFSRISLVYHIVESVGQRREPNTKINPKAAEMAGRLMIDFLLPNSIRFYTETLDDGSHMGHAKWIAGYILARKIEHTTPRDLQRAYRPLRNNRKNLFSAMHTLFLAGWVEKEENGKRVTWHVNPLVHDKFADRAKLEKERRENERRDIQVAVARLGLNQTQKVEK